MKFLIQKPVNQTTSVKSPTGKKNRIWLQGKDILKCFTPGETLKIVDQPDNETILIKTVDRNADRNDRSLRSVSSKTNRYSGAVTGLIELNESNSENLKNYKTGQLLQIVMIPGAIKITVKHDVLEERIVEREARLLHKLKNNLPIEEGVIFAGGGTETYMAHEGFKLAELPTTVRFVLDNYDEGIENLATNVAHVFDERSVLINSDISTIDIKSLPKLDSLVITPPCTDAAKCARAKKKDQMKTVLETDKTAHLVYYYAQILEHCQPALVRLENVTTFRNLASWHVISALLKQFGYKFQVRDINSHQEGYSLETRERMFVVAQSRDLNLDFDLDKVTPISRPKQVLSECLDYVDLASEVWKTYSHLFKKMAKDSKKGNSFKMQIFESESTYISTIRAQYQKAGSTDPLIKHPFIEGLYRQLSKIEHCRIKEIPLKFVRDTVEGHGQFILGNGISGLISKSISYFLAKSLQRLAKSVTDFSLCHQMAV